ncbi:MAG TPA: hypothetical protein VLX11_09655 [Candidatus Acidoferrales bacterium]|nr:hypothetical protein [Candidatus Acidoferrales bacterium]
MDNKFIPADIERFINETIDSVAQLEALLLFRRNPEERWNIRDLADRLYISEKQTTELVIQLCAAGLVTQREPARYQYQPNSTELKRKIDQLAELYAKHLVPITNLIHSKPKTRVREFADAFKFRKDD